MQHDVIYARQPYGLGLDNKLMPEYFKELGYATHMVGKVLSQNVVKVVGVVFVL